METMDAYIIAINNALSEEGLRWIEKKAKTKFGEYIIEELRGRACCFLDNILEPYGEAPIITLSKVDLYHRFGRVKHKKRVFQKEAFKVWLGLRYKHLDNILTGQIDIHALQSYLEQHLIDICEMAEVFRQISKHNMLHLAAKGVITGDVANCMVQNLLLTPTHLNGVFEVLDIVKDK